MDFRAVMQALNQRRLKVSALSAEPA